MEEIREKMFRELREFLTVNRISALVKIDYPASGSVIKLNGVALYKVLNTPNPFKKSGIAVHRNLSDQAIQKIGGKRAKGKNGWVAAPLNSYNYPDIFAILTQIALSANSSRNKQMRRSIVEIKKEKKEKEVKPKKKRAKLSSFKNNTVFDEIATKLNEIATPY